MKWKFWICLILSAVLLSSCTAQDVEDTTAPTKATGPYGMEVYTQWLGHPAKDALAALGDAKTTEFMGLSFSLSPLTEGELFSGVELTTQLNDADGQVAAAVGPGAGDGREICHCGDQPPEYAHRRGEFYFHGGEGIL